MQKMSKESILAMVKNDPKAIQFLNEIQNWDNVSFDPLNKTICVKISNYYGVRTVSFAISIPSPQFKFQF
jgi:hypothetical protein